jgi:hypothetical protein
VVIPINPSASPGIFPEISDRHKPSKLIKNQNTSTINADKLKAKMSETIISKCSACVQQ